MLEVLRERCCSPKGGPETSLPVVHPKAWRHSRHAPRSSSWRHSPLGHSERYMAAAYGRRRRAVHFALLALLAVAVLGRAGMHLLTPPPPELADLQRLDGDWPSTQQHSADPAAAAAALKEAKLIPRILHQAYPGGVATLLAPQRRWMASWRALNPGWEVRLYSDQQCLEFVQHEFPEYWEAYRRLGKGTERTHFFRYMVILRHGGVYADVDAECRRPLDGLLHSKDTLVAGWDNEFPDAAAALEAGYVRQRQLSQYVFAGAPGHPALRDLCERIAAAVTKHNTFSSDARINALERTGAGLFTDVLLQHAAEHTPARRDDPWGVRLLPRVRFGAPQAPAYGLTPTDAGVVVLHHSDFAGRDEHGSSRWVVGQQRGMGRSNQSSSLKQG